MHYAPSNTSPSNPARRAWCAAILWLGLAFTLAVATGADDGTIDEAKAVKVKAAFLLNFVRFTQWPDKAFDSDKAPLVVGVVGDDPFGAVLDQTFEGKTAENHPIQIRRFPSSGPGKATPDQLKACQVLYIPKSESARLKEHLAAVGDAPVLTVGDADGMTMAGGVIELVLTNGKVSFMINRKAAERVALKLSAKLLQLGKIVEERPKGG